MDLASRYPAVSDLRARAKRRLPRFVWDFLDSATGTEATAQRNRAALDAVLFSPSILHGEIDPDPGTALFERTVATMLPEEVGPATGGEGWFQIYPPRDPEIRADTLRRAREAGFRVLVLTVDVPAPSRRERQVRAGLRQPPRLTPRLALQTAVRPAWALAVARAGLPRMKLFDAYAADLQTRSLPSTAHAGYLLRTSPDMEYLRRLREAWEGPFVAKGVLRPEDARRLDAEGVDAIWVSNHAGRQFDGAPATADVLPAIRAATKLPLIADGGIEGGLDILRLLTISADFVMMGRAWHYALAALGPAGPAHLIDILRADLIANMHQLGAATLADLPAPVYPPKITP